MIDSRPGTLARAAANRSWMARGERLGRMLVGGARAVHDRLDAMVTRVARWQGHRLAIRELERLDNRLLKDIGLRRDQIPAAAAGLYRREPEAQAQGAARAGEEDRLKPAA